LRILYVSTLEQGGPVTHLRALAPAIANRGFDVLVACPSERAAAAYRSAGVAATVLPLRHKSDVIGAARMWRTLGDADIVHTHDRRAGLFGRVLATMRGAKVVHTLHGLPEDLAIRLGRPRDGSPALPPVTRVRHRIHAQVESRLAALGVVVTPSRAMGEWLAAQGVPDSRIEVIGHWMDVRQHRPRARTQRMVIGVAAQLEPWKGIDVLIDACARAAEPACLEVFGDGSQRANLQRQAADRRVDAHFHGHVPNVREHLGELDLFVSPSRAENSPLAIMEAMAHGLPVIATRVGGVAELVDDGRTGVLVEPDNSSALAAALDRLAANAALADALGQSGALRVAREFSESRVLPRFTALYYRIVSSPRGAIAGR